MPVRAAFAAILLLLLSACGGAEQGAGAPAGGDGSDAAAPSDTGLDASVTVDTQALPGDTAAGAR